MVMTRLKSITKYLVVLAAAVFISNRIDARQTVVDGDTLVIGRQRIRLIDIDAPETGQTCTCKGKQVKCGIEAKNILSNLIGANIVSCKSSGRDLYGRLLAECFITKSTDEISLNRSMVRAGAAVVISKQNEILLQEESTAIRQKKGIWGCEDFQMPSEFRKSVQNNRSI